MNLKNLNRAFRLKNRPSPGEALKCEPHHTDAELEAFFGAQQLVYRSHFRTGALAMREMLARFVEQGGDHVTANSIRHNWMPSWGRDPGKWEGKIPEFKP